MRIGILGGTLDPVHLGHLSIARAALERLDLDGVWLLPSGRPPHKGHTAPPMDRLEMARRAAEGLDWLTADDTEVAREGTTYTVDTLTAYTSAHPGWEFVYIIGADTVPVLHLWRDFPRVAKLTRFAALLREGFDDSGLAAAIARLEKDYGARIERLDFSGPDISSTGIRSRRRRGERIDDLVPPGVAAYIREKGLYLCAYSQEEIREMLKGVLKPGRYRHTLGVADTARRLAPQMGLDPMRAYLTGLLHDCAKSMKPDEMEARLRASSLDVDEAEYQAPQVLHAPMGALLAREVYGVEDEEILSAIRKHTLGGPRMTALETLIYLADFIEPGREEFPGLKETRALAEQNVYAAARFAARLTSDHVTRQGGRPHARTLALLQESND